MLQDEAFHISPKIRTSSSKEDMVMSVSQQVISGGKNEKLQVVWKWFNFSHSGNSASHAHSHKYRCLLGGQNGNLVCLRQQSVWQERNLQNKGLVYADDHAMKDLAIFPQQHLNQQLRIISHMPTIHKYLLPTTQIPVSALEHNLMQ